MPFTPPPDVRDYGIWRSDTGNFGVGRNVTLLAPRDASVVHLYKFVEYY